MTVPAPDFGARLANVAHGLFLDPEVDATLQRSVELTRLHLPSAEWVSISLLEGRRSIRTPASTHPWADRADEIQYAADQGPCLDAIRRTEFVLVDDLGTGGSASYPRWAPAVLADTGIRSSFSCRLYSDKEVFGAMNVYAGHVGAFTAPQRAEARVIAAQVGLALHAARQVSGLRQGMEGRTVIGQAQGILMERFKVPSSRAFEMLSRVSQDTNTRLREVAAMLVDTGETPEERPNG